MLETTMMVVAELGVQRRRELLADPARARQARFARLAGRYDRAAAQPEPARTGGGTRAAPRVRAFRAFRLRHQSS